MKTDPKSLYQLQGRGGFFVLVILAILFLFTCEDTNGQVEVPMFGDSLESGTLGNWVEVQSVIASVSIIDTNVSEVVMNGLYHIKGIAGNGSFNGSWTLENSVPLSFESGKTYTVRTANMSRASAFDPAVNIQSGLYLTVGKGNGITLDLGGYTKPDYINSTSGTDDTIRVFETTFVCTETTDSVYLNLYQHSFRSYMYIDDITVVEQVAESITITQPLQDQYFTKGDSVVINWISTGVDSVSVNGVHMINNNTYTTTASIVSGIYPLNVASLIDGQASLTIYDLITVRVVDSTKLEILSTSVVNRDVTLQTIASTNLDSLIFYVGLDTNDMSYLGESQILGLDTTYTFTLPTTFHVSGNYYYKVMNDVDTSTYIDVDEEIVPLGMPMSDLQNTCWYSSEITNVSVIREHDSGCRWVNTMPIDWHWFLLQSEPATSDFSDSLVFRYRLQTCEWDGIGLCPDNDNGWWTIVNDTLTTIQDTFKTQTISALSLPTPYVVGTRTYYKHSVWILCDDSATGVDSIIVKQLSDLDASSTFRVMKYEPPYNYEIFSTDGTSSGLTRALTELDKVKFIIYRGSANNEGWSYFNAPTEGEDLIYDIYLASDNITYIRNYFRGINPKILK